MLKDMFLVYFIKNQLVMKRKMKIVWFNIDNDKTINLPEKLEHLPQVNSFIHIPRHREIKGLTKDIDGEYEYLMRVKYINFDFDLDIIKIELTEECDTNFFVDND